MPSDLRESGQGVDADKAPDRPIFDEFLDRCHAALIRQAQGDSAPLLDLWDHGNTPTLLAAVGGYETGYDLIDGLLSKVSQTLSWDTISFESLAVGRNHDMAFTVELERMTRTVEGKAEEMTIRATQVYVIKDGSWRLVHRHGDVLTPYMLKW